MHYTLIGAGSIGRALLSDVINEDPQAKFSVFDIDEHALSLAKRFDPNRIQTGTVKEPTSKHFSRLMHGSDLVINCTAGAQCIEILQAVISTGVRYLDVHGTLLLKERLALHTEAKAAGITAMIGVGVSPGLTNMLGAYIARQTDELVDIDCEYATMRALNPTQGLLETALRQMRNGVTSVVYEDGKTTYHPPFSGTRPTRFHGLDEDFELVYTPHSEPVTVPMFVPNARRVTVRGTYDPRIQTLLKSLYEFGLLDPNLKVPVDGKPVDFQPLLREALMGDGTLKPADVEARYVMRVRVASAAGERSITLGHPPGWDPLPQGRMTALPAAYLSQVMARGEIDYQGVCSPEVISDSQVEDCLDYLRKRGLTVHKSQQPAKQTDMAPSN